MADEDIARRTLIDDSPSQQNGIECASSGCRLLGQYVRKQAYSFQVAARPPLIGQADHPAPSVPQALGHLSNRPDPNYECWFGRCREEMVASCRTAGHLNVDLGVG